MDKQLKLVAASIVMDSKLGKQSKQQLLNFIKEASIPQIKAFLMDGKIVKLDEHAISLVNARFESYTYLKESGIFLQILANMVGMLPVWRRLAATFSDAHRQCGIKKISSDRDACLANARLKYAQNKMKVIQSALQKCKDMKNPNKCQVTLRAQLEKVKAEVNKQQEKLNKEISKGRSPGSEPAPMVATRD
jgi:hypothetical protein